MGGFHPGAARTGRTLGFKSQLLHLVATSPEQNEPRFPPLYRGAYDSNMSNHLGCQSLGDRSRDRTLLGLSSCVYLFSFPREINEEAKTALASSKVQT